MQSLSEPLQPRQQGKQHQHVCLEGVQNGGVVPCKERVRFKNLTGDKLTFKANKTYVHCEVSQGAQTECIVWHRVEEVCCRQQAGEGSDGFVLLGPAFTKGGCLRGAVWKRHGRCLGRIRNVVPNLPRVLPEMTMVGASASMSVMPTKFFRAKWRKRVLSRRS